MIKPVLTDAPVAMDIICSSGVLLKGGNDKRKSIAREHAVPIPAMAIIIILILIMIILIRSQFIHIDINIIIIGSGM